MKLSIDKQSETASTSYGQTAPQKWGIAVAGWAVVAVATTLQPAAAAHPAGHGHSHNHGAGHSHAAVHSHAALDDLPAPDGAPMLHGVGGPGYHRSLPADHRCGCSGCGKKRKSIFRRVLDGMTAGADRLMFGSSHPGGVDCDSYGGGFDTPCDAPCDAMGSMEFATLPSGLDRYHPHGPAAPDLRELPAPVDGESLPEPLHDAHQSAPPAPDQNYDPFIDDPVYQGTNPAITRSAYYE